MFLPGDVHVNSSDMSDSRSDRTPFALLKRRDEEVVGCVGGGGDCRGGPQQILHYSRPIHRQTFCLLVLLLYRRNPTGMLELALLCQCAVD